MPEHLTPAPRVGTPGGRSQAWEIDLTKYRHAPDTAAAVALWLIDAPGYTPGWSKYILSIVHLRPEAGLPDPRLDGPESTHEVVIAAIDPDLPVTPEALEGGLQLTLLTPINLSIQVRRGTDEEMVLLARLMARSIVEDMMPPEPAFSTGPGSQFHAAWTVAIENTLHHLRAGTAAHPA